MNSWATAVRSNRWWIYQRERFPVFAHGLLIAVFSASAVTFSWLLRGGHGFPAWLSFLLAGSTSFGIFLQLRIADEFKDYEEDSRFRAYRPVPRGLVRLRELGWIGFVAGAVQLSFALAVEPRLVPLLLVTWAYLALMTREFFIRDWIREKPITYLWTHMLILPLTDLYATACDWMLAGDTPPPGLGWFIAVSFFNGVGLEIGRKTRAPEDEETGVRSYSHLWGRKWAAGAWLGALALTALCTVAAAATFGGRRSTALIMGVQFTVAAWLAVRFLRRPVHSTARWLEHFSGIWTVVTYLSLGAVPLVTRIAKHSP